MRILTFIMEIQISLFKMETLSKIINFFLPTIKHRNKYDIVFVRFVALELLIPGIIAKMIFKKKLVVMYSGTNYPLKEEKWLRLFIKIAIKISDAVVGRSWSVINGLEDEIGEFERKKTHIVRQSVDTTQFKPDSKSGVENVLISVGRVHPQKGLDGLIKAIPHVKKTIPDVKLKIIGQPTTSDKSYLNTLINLVSKLDCEKNIKFIGPVPNTKLVDWYNSAEIFILNSRREAGPYVLLEAMACGKPVIATSVGVVPDLIKNGINGIIVENNTPEILAKEIIHLLSNPRYREKLGQTARSTIQEKHSGDFFVNDLSKIFYLVSNIQNKSKSEN